MAAYFATDEPSRLLAAIRAAVDDGSVLTWSYDSDGDFTHTAHDWPRRAWMRPAVEKGRLAFYFIISTTETRGREVYAVYHGRIVEMVTAHFDRMFSIATVTALGVGGMDRV